MDPTAFVLDGPRRGVLLTDGQAVARALADDELAWVHLQADDPQTMLWLQTHLDYLGPQAMEALTAQETRPRALRIGEGALVNLRGVNTNREADPEDMVSIRMWLDPRRIVTLSLRPLRAVDEIRAAIGAGDGPQGPGAFLAMMVENLTGRIEDTTGQLDDHIDEMEETVLAASGEALRQKVLDARQSVIRLRRFLLPQRDALLQLSILRLSWIDEDTARRLTEEHDALVRSVEDLDAMRDRLAVIRDEIQSALSDRLNRNLYILSVISAVFLPLGFLTGLMGINLAGMPGADWAPAFWVFTGALAVIGGAVLVLFRARRWI